MAPGAGAYDIPHSVFVLATRQKLRVTDCPMAIVSAGTSANVEMARISRIMTTGNRPCGRLEGAFPCPSLRHPGIPGVQNETGAVRICRPPLPAFSDRMLCHCCDLIRCAIRTLPSPRYWPPALAVPRRPGERRRSCHGKHSMRVCVVAMRSRERSAAEWIASHACRAP